MKKVNIVIRTLNEERYLAELLTAIERQETEFAVYVTIVDSGSTDATLKIASRTDARIIRIKKSEFSFGFSLNKGIESVEADIVVAISGHCVPEDENWLQHLCEPIRQGLCGISYGRQVGGAETLYSESRVFEKYYPDQEKQNNGIFCNNANSAYAYGVWEKYRFDEELTGLEDMELAKRYADDGGLIGYIPAASVEHRHHEDWAQIKRRYEREAIALKEIMPQVQVGLLDSVRYVVFSVVSDLISCPQSLMNVVQIHQIVRYRFAQFSGAYVGGLHHKRMSKKDKEEYYYPVVKEVVEVEKNRGVTASQN